MSYQRMMYAPLVLLFLMTAGCAAFSPIGDSSPEELRKAEMTKDELWNQAKALEKEKAAYQKRLADQEEELARMAKDLSDQQSEIAQANRQVGELNKSVGELNAQMRQLQEVRQKAPPLKEFELVQKKKEPAKPVKKTRVPKKEVRKAAPEVKAQEPQSADTSAMLKEIADAKQKLTAAKEVSEAAQKKKEAEAAREKITDAKQEAQPVAPPAKGREPRSLDDLSQQMKQFEEAEQRESAAKEAAAPVKKGAIKEDKPVGETKQIARKSAAETKPPRQKALKIKILAGDGNITSARSLSKRLGKMGYRVNLIDKAPRSDFDTPVVYYGNEHRTAAETMAKRMGSGAALRPLTWSSAFDIIVVTGRQP